MKLHCWVSNIYILSISFPQVDQEREFHWNPFGILLESSSHPFLILFHVFPLHWHPISDFSCEARVRNLLRQAVVGISGQCHGVRTTAYRHSSGVTTTGHCNVSWSFTLQQPQQLLKSRLQFTVWNHSTVWSLDFLHVYVHIPPTLTISCNPFTLVATISLSNHCDCIACIVRLEKQVLTEALQRPKQRSSESTCFSWSSCRCTVVAKWETKKKKKHVKLLNHVRMLNHPSTSLQVCLQKFYKPILRYQIRLQPRGEAKERGPNISQCKLLHLPQWSWGATQLF